VAHRAAEPLVLQAPVPLSVPGALGALASPLAPLGPFASTAPVHLSVTWPGDEQPAGPAIALESREGAPHGFASWAGPALEFSGPPLPTFGLAALRGAWAAAAAAAGGTLLHGAGLLYRGEGLVVTGPPDAGKSTCAGLALAAGASLLSDELVVLFPDGTVQGTPFCSSLRAPSSPERVRCAALLTLDKAGGESVSPAAPAAFAHTLLSQVWSPEGLGLPLAEARAAALSCAGQAFCGTFAFRKHPDAGRFLLEWLDAL